MAVALALFTDHDIHLPDPERYVGREDATASGWGCLTMLGTLRA